MELGKMAQLLERYLYRYFFVKYGKGEICTLWGILIKLAGYEKASYITKAEAKQIILSVHEKVLGDFVYDDEDIKELEEEIKEFVIFKDYAPKEQEQEEVKSETIEEDVELVEQEEVESEVVEEEEIEKEHIEEREEEDEINILILSDVDVIPLLRPFEKIKLNELNNRTLNIEYLTSENIIVPSLRFGDFDMVFVEIDKFNVNDLLVINPKETITPIVAICNSFEIGMEALKNGATNYILDPPCPLKLTEIIKQIKAVKNGT